MSARDGKARAGGARGAADVVDCLLVVGAGIELETWSNQPDSPEDDLWQAVRRARGGYIMRHDEGAYPADAAAAAGRAQRQLLGALGTAVGPFVEGYPLPLAVVAGGEVADDATAERIRAANARRVVPGAPGQPFTAVGALAGLPAHRGQVIRSSLGDFPDRLWNGVFAAFDAYADLPAFGLAALEGGWWRAAGVLPAASLPERSAAFLPRHPRILSDSCTVLTLARRERVDWLRPYAPLVQDRLPAAGAAAGETTGFCGWKKIPSQPFVPTSFVTEPWTARQLAQYDRLAPLAVVYRPQVIAYADGDWKSAGAAERQRRMDDALKAVLTPLGGAMPTRIVYDYGSVLPGRQRAARWLPLVRGVQQVDPDFDMFDPERAIDLCGVLGDTGAASSMVAVALATMACAQSGGATLVANLRRDAGATLLLVVPAVPDPR